MHPTSQPANETMLSQSRLPRYSPRLNSTVQDLWPSRVSCAGATLSCQDYVKRLHWRCAAYAWEKGSGRRVSTNGWKGGDLHEF